MTPIDLTEVRKVLRYPLVVKANRQGSTIGLTVVKETLIKARL